MKEKFENEITDEEIERVIRILNKVQNESKSDEASPLNELCNCNKNQAVTRSFKIYKEVLDEFVNFCSKSKYPQYEILSKFILEGIQKYS